MMIPGLIIAAVLGVATLGYAGGIFEINPDKLDETIENLSSSVDPATIETSVSSISESIEKTIKTSSTDIIEQIKKNNPPETSSKDYALKSIHYINQKRTENGKDPITHDPRVYELALARVQDMHEYQYFDHTNPYTGTCPYNIKSDYGLKSHENVAENASLFGTETHPTTRNPDHIAIIDGWMDSTGHRINLLSYEHVAGSVACYGGFCVFLGLNHGLYGEGCYTAAEGMAYASHFENCSSEQMAQYDVMRQEYDLIPPIVSSSTQYYEAVELLDKIENFTC